MCSMPMEEEPSRWHAVEVKRALRCRGIPLESLRHRVSTCFEISPKFCCGATQLYSVPHFSSTFCVGLGLWWHAHLYSCLNLLDVVQLVLQICTVATEESRKGLILLKLLVGSRKGTTFGAMLSVDHRSRYDPVKHGGLRLLQQQALAAQI